MDEPAMPKPELEPAYSLAAGAEAPLLPARMVNQIIYSPRLAYLELMQAEWADSADKVDGRLRIMQVWRE